MAITVDVANVGTFTRDTPVTPDVIALTTSSAVAAGGFIVLALGQTGSNSLVQTVSGGGLTWTIDKQGTGPSRGVCIASAQAPSGLASSTVIQATYAASSGVAAHAIGATSLLGVKTSSPVDGTPLGPTDVNNQNWSTGSYTIAAGSIILGACFSVNGSSNTPTSPSVDAWEAADVPDNYGTVLSYRIESSAGSYAVAGQWNTSGNNVNVAVAYLAAAAGADTGLAWIRA